MKDKQNSPTSMLPLILYRGGEMGKLINSKDWSKTAIGPIEHWPQSLIITLNIILQNRFPMFLFWGPELICFYNDAYRPSLGQNGKHPSMLGMPGADAWQEIWDIIKPLIDQVFAGGDATWSEDQLVPIYRNGQIEDVYWTFSYSPVNDEWGSVAGVLVTCNETTDKVITRNNLKESKDQLHFAIEAAELGTWDYNTTTKVFNCNDRLKNWFGITSKQTPKLSVVLNTINEFERQKISEAARLAFYSKHKGNFEVEFSISHPKTQKETILRALGKVWYRNDDTPAYYSGTLQNVTMQVLSQRKIKESERNLRLIIQQAPVAIAILRGEQYIVEVVNASALELWGRTSEQVINKPVLTIMSELESQGIKDLLDHVYKTGKAFSARELPVDIVRNGARETVYVNFVYEPLYGFNGDINGIITVGTEVTTNVIALKKTRESQEKLNVIIKASELGTWEYNLATNEVNYSERYLEIFGYKTDSGLNHAQLLKHLHPHDHVVRDLAMQEAMLSGTIDYEARLIWNDKSVHWIEAKGTVFYDAEKNPVKLIGTVRDITDIKNHQQELEESEEKFRLLADSIPQFGWTGDASGNLNYFNQSVYDYSGLTPEQVSHSGWLQIVHPDDREDNIKTWMHSINTGQDFLFEHRFRRSDGEFRWQLSRATPQRDAEGNIQMWVGSSTDIQQIKEQDQQKDYFISMASHELRTPITSMKGYVQLLKHKYSNNEDTFLKNSLNVIDKQIITLTSLISELLDISKIKTGMLLLKKEHFQINDLIKDIVNEITHVHPGYKLIFERSVEKQVFADRDRIGQVLINFLTNAIKYSPNADEVKITSRVDDGHITVLVQDYGIGINKNDQDKIFQRFYRVEGKSEKTFSGFGIGLFIAAEIIQRHYGKIGVKSEPGKGSLFYFSLPVESNQ